MDAIQIITTAPSRKLAMRIAEELVEKRLAACVQLDGPLYSIYRWQGKVERGVEWRLSIKTLASRFDSVATAIREVHTYDVPEILAFPVARGSDSYLNWLAREVAD
jgi:periplasmic divalent cation tolerance protein